MDKIIDIAKRLRRRRRDGARAGHGAGRRRDHALQPDRRLRRARQRRPQIEPHLIELVQDREGKTIFRADDRDCDGCNRRQRRREPPPALPDTREQVDGPDHRLPDHLDAARAWSSAAPARGAASLGRPLGGKTGTTNDFQRLVRGLLARPGGRRLRRLRRQPQPGRGRDRRQSPRCRSSSTSCSEALKRPAASAVPHAARHPHRARRRRDGQLARHARPPVSSPRRSGRAPSPTQQGRGARDGQARLAPAAGARHARPRAARAASGIY